MAKEGITFRYDCDIAPLQGKLKILRDEMKGIDKLAPTTKKTFYLFGIPIWSEQYKII